MFEKQIPLTAFMQANLDFRFRVVNPFSECESAGLSTEVVAHFKQHWDSFCTLIKSADTENYLVFE